MTTCLVIALESDDFFSCRLLTTPIFPVFFLNSATKIILFGCLPPWIVSPGAVRPPKVTPLILVKYLWPNCTEWCCLPPVMWIESRSVSCSITARCGALALTCVDIITDTVLSCKPETGKINQPVHCVYVSSDVTLYIRNEKAMFAILLLQRLTTNST